MENTKKYIKLAELLAKEFAGEQPEKESLKLFENDEEARQIAHSVRHKAFKPEHLNKYKSYNVQKARKKVAWRIGFVQRTKIKKIWNLLRYASVIVLPLAIAGYLFYYSLGLIQTGKFSQIPEQIEPGETKAQLYLSDGRIVDLENAEKLFIQEKAGTVIKKDDSGLNYHSGSNTSKESIENVVVTPVGGEYQLKLSDGTRVWLNALSEIRYPVNFNGKERKVKVSGEVYFEVTKDQKRPFIVDLNDVSIKVTGTQFNVKAYPEEANIETTLVEGAVRLEAKELSGNLSAVNLKPGIQARFHRFSKKIETREVEVENYIAWKQGKFIFQKENLSDIMRELERWYNVKVFFENKDLKTMRFSARINRYGNINDLLRKVEQTTNISFVVKDKVIVVKKRLKNKMIKRKKCDNISCNS